MRCLAFATVSLFIAFTGTAFASPPSAAEKASPGAPQPAVSAERVTDASSSGATAEEGQEVASRMMSASEALLLSLGLVGPEEGSAAGQGGSGLEGGEGWAGLQSMSAVPAISGVLTAALETVQSAAGPASLLGKRWGSSGTPSRIASDIVQRAVSLVGLRSLARVSRRVTDDCAGFVRLAYLKVGIDLVTHGFLAGENAVSAIYRRAQSQGALHNRRPRPGDLVFFRETYDRNRDGRRNDGMTHIGVVEQVEPEGTVTFIHRGSKGIARARMNLLFPRIRRAGQTGPVLNDFIRAAAKGQRAYLAGELFAGFASHEVM